MNSPQEPVGKRERRGFSRRKTASLKIDMTPMVDLGFLLISFFVITTQLSEAKATPLYMPAEGKPTPLGMSYALTIIPTEDNVIYYYEGDWLTAQNSGTIYKASFAGKNSIRNVIIEKQKNLRNNASAKEGRDGLMLMIKPSHDASYRNLVDVIDEVLINDVRKYALMPLTKEEKEWLAMYQ